MLSDEQIMDNLKKTDDANEVSIRTVILKIKNLYSFLISKWILILIAGLIGGLIGLTYALIKKPIYKAELSFALEDDKSAGGLGAALGLAGQMGLDLGGNSSGPFSENNIPEVMKSRSMIETALLTPVDINSKRMTLAQLYLDFNKYRESWKNKPSLQNINFPVNANRDKFSLQQDSILNEFYKNILKQNLNVDKVDKKLSIITVTTTSTHELFSKYFTEVLAKTVSDFYVQTKTKKSQQNVNILQHQADSVSQKLNLAIVGVASSADANPNANPTRQILRVSSQQRQVDVQANQAILTQLIVNLELSKIALRKETPLIQVIDRPILPLDKEKPSKIIKTITGGFAGVFFISIFLLLTDFIKKSQ